MYTIVLPDDLYNDLNEYVYAKKLNSLINYVEHPDEQGFLRDLNKRELWRKIDYCVSVAKHGDGEIEIPDDKITRE